MMPQRSMWHGLFDRFLSLGALLFLFEASDEQIDLGFDILQKVSYVLQESPYSSLTFKPLMTFSSGPDPGVQAA